MVVRFANVNGTGSASANDIFAKAIFRMGIPVSPKNIFPSNIQGLPTWYEVRISEQGYLARREGIDLLVGVNPQSLKQDIASIKSGGYLMYDSTKVLHDEYLRADINYIGIPMMELSMANYEKARHQQLFKNIIYVGALSALLNIEIEVIQNIISEQFAKKPKLVPPNFKALDLGRQYALDNFNCPLDIQVERRDLNGDKILIDGNTATAMGALYAGATVMAWYPITPSTSVASYFDKLASKYRIDEDGKKKYAFIQAEDELAAIGMTLGANWNGARAFTATSGAGVSLMSEFIGLSYFAEIPAVLINVQRGGPSTGMPTRTQQGDILSCAYASHGDTKHVLLFPSTPTECFEMTAKAFDLAERLQTLVFVMSDLDLGMNNHLTDKLVWDDSTQFDRGKVLDAETLEEMESFSRYLDVDGDGIPYRTIPGVHPTKGSYFTRGSSKNEHAKYTEDGNAYMRNVDRLAKKWETAKTLVPNADIEDEGNSGAMLYFGTSEYAVEEAQEVLRTEGIHLDAIRIKAFPFNDEVAAFVEQHETIYIIEQNRDAQFKSLLVNELQVHPKKFVSVLNYDGTPIAADVIIKKIKDSMAVEA